LFSTRFLRVTLLTATKLPQTLLRILWLVCCDWSRGTVGPLARWILKKVGRIMVTRPTIHVKLPKRVWVTEIIWNGSKTRPFTRSDFGQLTTQPVVNSFPRAFAVHVVPFGIKSLGDFISEKTLCSKVAYLFSRHWNNSMLRTRIQQSNVI
jgi:hypothetical protein